MIHIMDRFYVKPDQYSWVVIEKKTNKKTGATSMVAISYPSTLVDALVYIRKKQLYEMTDSQSMEMTELIDKINKLDHEFIKAISDLKSLEVLRK